MLHMTDIHILAELALKSRYGYELCRHLPTIAAASIYYSLHKLAGLRLCTVRVVATSVGPVRKQYRITASGKKELQKALQLEADALHQSARELLVQFLQKRAQIQQITTLNGAVNDIQNRIRFQ